MWRSSCKSALTVIHISLQLTHSYIQTSNILDAYSKVNSITCKNTTYECNMNDCCITFEIKFFLITNFLVMKKQINFEHLTLVNNIIKILFISSLLQRLSFNYFSFLTYNNYGYFIIVVDSRYSSIICNKNPRFLTLFC